MVNCSGIHCIVFFQCNKGLRIRVAVFSQFSKLHTSVQQKHVMSPLLFLKLPYETEIFTKDFFVIILNGFSDLKPII